MSEPDLTEIQQAYNLAMYEAFQLAAYGHCTYTTGELLSPEGNRKQNDYNNRIWKANRELEAAVLRLVAEHAERVMGTSQVSTDWLRSLAEDRDSVAIMASPDEEEDLEDV